MKSLEFDNFDFRFKKARRPVRAFFKYVLGVFLASILVCAFAYLAFAFFFSTRTEKQLIEDNTKKAAEYARLREDDKLLSEALTALQAKDADIFAAVFKSPAPNADPVGKLDFLFASDTLPDTHLVSYVAEKTDILLARAAKVDEEFEKIAGILSDKDLVLPPMSLPLEGINYVQVGATEGMKAHPYYNSQSYHDGIDFIVPRYYPVLSTAKGVVTEVVESPKGKGNSVTIAHAGGWKTRYSHLSEIKVSEGNRVSLGQVIGTSGMSGMAFAPHLHYEVIKDSLVMNPINFIFASVSSGEYANMLYMGANTSQSMD